MSSYIFLDFDKQDALNIEQVKNELEGADAKIKALDASTQQCINLKNELDVLNQTSSATNEQLKRNNTLATDNNANLIKNNELAQTNIQTLINSNGQINLNEDTRKKNEEVRIKNEDVRISNENQRITNEKNREATIKEVDAKCDKMTEEYNQALANMTNGSENATNSEIVQARGNAINLGARIDGIDEELAKKSTLTNKHLAVINDRTSNVGAIDLANFAGQNLGKAAPIGFIFHHYTDSTLFEMDNVGNSTGLLVKNANNPVRRSDKDKEYVGNGVFLELAEDYFEQGNKKGRTLFLVDSYGQFIWTGAKTGSTTATLIQNKQNDGIYAFRFKTNYAHDYLLDIFNGDKSVLDIVEDGGFINIRGKDKLKLTSQNGDLIITATNGNILFGKEPKVYIDNQLITLQTNRKCSSTTRPSNPEIGDMCYDTTLKKPIWWSGEQWCDAMGQAV